MNYVKKYGIHSIKNKTIMSSKEQYKELHKRQKATIRDLNLALEKLTQQLKKSDEELYLLGARIHLLKFTPWWKMRKLIKLILKLRRS